MSLNIGIVGLPNVGKSTIFNALTKAKSAQAANYPFCTIEPNVGIVEVPDERLNKLSEISESKKKIPAVIQFVDIAGLVKGAGEGEGLGNKFLAHIRECSAIAHVIRLFDDPNITHVHGAIDPRFDKEIIESELIIADIQTAEKRLQKAISDAKSGDSKKTAYAKLIEKVLNELKQGILASEMSLELEQKELLSDLNLLSFKPVLYIINVPEKDISKIDRKAYADALNVSDIGKIIPISAKVEEDLIGFGQDEAEEYLKELGLQSSGLDLLISSAYSVLGLITYFTSGEQETRAWTIEKGWTAPKAAGVIHTDFERGFIKAEVFNWREFVTAGGESKAKENGYMRLEGKDYVVKDGDVMHFKFAV